jgi:hypothetical protein
MYEYIRILLGARPILPISRLKVNVIIQADYLEHEEYNIEEQREYSTTS